MENAVSGAVPVSNGQAPSIQWGDLAVTFAIALAAVAVMLSPPVRRLWLPENPNRGAVK